MPTLSSITSPGADRLQDSVLVVPVGATEQHGPHLPLTTDSDLAVALAERLIEGRDDVVAAPAIAYGASGEHQSFAGTLSIGQEATELLLVELGRSAAGTWSRVLLLSTHGGNDVPLRRAVRRLRDEGLDVRCWSPSWGGDAHAGRTETSLMLAVAPHQVDQRRAERGCTAELAAVLPVLMREGVASVSANGVLGDPTAATADEGVRLLDVASAQLSAFIDRWGDVADVTKA